jgi:alkyl sulfatase BDS1-like metallo-beta-lactamase superfamily hydrolase
MKKISRRRFLSSGAAALALSSSLIPAGQGEASTAETLSLTDLPFSKEREGLNEIIRAAPKPRVIKARDQVYYAVDYALANMVMVETREGLVIIDTTESLTAARTIMAEFRKISNRPVKAVLYTHNHVDHFRGTRACFEEGVQVIAHNDFMKEVQLQDSRGLSARLRAGAMFGVLMPLSERFPWVGTFPQVTTGRLMWEEIAPADLIWPNHTFADRYSFRLGGLTFNLIHAPGETPDQFIVEIPELKFVCCADNYYPSFPNLYTIRGTSARPVLDWADCQDKIMGLKPEVLVPCHGSHLEGKDRIREVLTNYRDAIRHVYHYTLKAVGKFKPIQEAAADVALPAHLAQLPYLRQHYGYLPYCVRSIYESLVGWFDGDPVNLNPLLRRDLGREILEIAGSADKILTQAAKAQKTGRHQAVLELCELILANEPDNRAARMMKINSLTALSRGSINKPTINYYETFALIEKNRLDKS